MCREAEFVSHIRNHLKEYGFSLIFGRGKSLNVGNARCDGYFLAEGNYKEIRVARGNKHWVNVLAHEYCHFLQWMETTTAQLKRESRAQFIVHEISTGYTTRRWSKRQVTYAFKTIQAMERDCEIRTVKLLKEWGIPFNVDLYIRRANLYVYMHHMWRIYQQQASKFDPESSRKIIRMMPNNFRVKTHLILPEKVKQELSKAFV
jgi:hypothetical protein